MSAPGRTAVVGFGEVGSAFAAELRRRGLDVVAAVRPQRSRAAGAALEERLAGSGVSRAGTLAEVVPAADLVLAAVPARAAAGVAAECAGLLAPGTLYVDLAPAAPEAKAMAAEAVARAGGSYVDAAIMGSVATAGAAVPMLVSGPGAADLESGGLHTSGLCVSSLAGDAGSATRVKLLRSVYLKGRDALIVEMLLAARAHGLEGALMASLGDRPEDADFGRLAERTLCSLALHAGRRADELEQSRRAVADAGLDSTLLSAGVERLRWVGAHGLRERFGHTRPAGAPAVLEAIEAADGVARAGPKAAG